MQHIGILGGTFDPIHNGHLGLAFEAIEQLKLDQVKLIPLNIPPHRSKPVASPSQRCEMIESVIQDNPSICIDQRELESDAISYTINTLKSLRHEYEDSVFYLIIGRDAFDKIDSWKDWQELLDYTHIIVANRPGERNHNLSIELLNWIEQHQTTSQKLLKDNLSGKIYFIDIPMLDISSSMIRQLVSDNQPVDKLLATSTQNYIKENHLYLDTA
jgi:nicotinate-nucleotide adenylyltransferase